MGQPAFLQSFNCRIVNNAGCRPHCALRGLSPFSVYPFNSQITTYHEDIITFLRKKTRECILDEHEITCLREEPEFFVLHLVWWLTWKRLQTLWTLLQKHYLPTLPSEDTVIGIQSIYRACEYSRAWQVFFRTCFLKGSVKKQCLSFLSEKSLILQFHTLFIR